MRVDCYNCGGSGGGPDVALYCSSCRGRGWTEVDGVLPCDHCAEPTPNDPICQAGTFCDDCTEEFFMDLVLHGPATTAASRLRLTARARRVHPRIMKCRMCDGDGPDAGLCNPCEIEARAEMKELGYPMNSNEEKVIDEAAARGERDEQLEVALPMNQSTYTETVGAFHAKLDVLRTLGCKPFDEVSIFVQSDTLAVAGRSYVLCTTSLERLERDLDDPPDTRVRFSFYRSINYPMQFIVELIDCRQTETRTRKELRGS